MATHVFSQSIPSRVFNGRLNAKGRWFRIEIDSAESLQVVMQAGNGLGIGSRVRVVDGQNQRQFWVMVDATNLPHGEPTTLESVKAWIPKCAVVLAAAVVGEKQQIPDTCIFSVAAPDYSKDPQRSDARAFRKRCRFDILNVFASCVNSNPPAQSCKGVTLLDAESHTRIYDRDDIIDAVQYWQNRGYAKLLTRGIDVQIDQTRDDDMADELAGYSWDEGLPLTVAEVVDGTTASITAEYDVFISHASEDKGAVVMPLTDELVRQGLRVWVDYRELRLGDRLRQRIDDGLARSRFGVVVVSPRFFAKQWPQTELDGLVALEMADGKKRILPVWYDVAFDDVAKQSPSLAARLAVNWTEGIAKVAADIVREVQS